MIKIKMASYLNNRLAGAVEIDGKLVVVESHTPKQVKNIGKTLIDKAKAKIEA